MLNFIIKFFHLNKECALEEIQENGFRLAFGISIIIVGIFSYFYDTSNIILVGISISSFLFALFDSMSRGNSLSYILPLTILLLFCIFPDLPFIKLFLDEHLNNSIVFVSFGLTFCIFSYSSYIDRYKNLNQKYRDEIQYNKNILNQFENAIIITDLSKKIRKLCIEKKYIDEEMNDLLSELEQFANEEATLGSIKNELLTLNEPDIKTSFTIEEVENAIIKSAEYKRNEFNNINESKKTRKKK